MQAVINGKRVTRLEWESTEDYGLLKDGFLTIHTKGAFHQWIVSEADMIAEDWIILPELN